MLAKWKYILIAAVAVLCVSGELWFYLNHVQGEQSLRADLDKVVSSYRRIIVLMDGASALDDATRARCRATGRRIFWDKEQALEDVSATLARTPRLIPAAIHYISSDHFRDADRLAFLDLFEDLGNAPAPSKEMKSAVANLHSIQNAYREEVSRIFSQFATRGAEGKREKWDAYVAWLRTMMSREHILDEFGAGLTDETESGVRGLTNPNEIWGNEFETHTVALTFDDGPHRKYTEEITALLRKYGMRAAFFEVGRSLGTVDGEEVKLLKTGEISRRLMDAGHTIANHTYSHPALTRLPEADRTQEIQSTSRLLEKATGVKPLLFRPPYGARNKAIVDQATGLGMKTVLWNIDSEDWADPIPESIAMRVLHQLTQKQKGIILLHDIHKQSVLALPLVLDELVQQDYTFLAFDGSGFVPSAPPEGEDRTLTSNRVPRPAAHTATGEKFNPYRKSWAVIIGVNEYQKWPRLSYPVNDANAIERVLVNRFAFQPENVRKLLNGDATRQRIMQVLGDELSDTSRVNHDDRVFFFFAGHGATRTVGDNHQIGFIIPSDADPDNDFSTAISMTALREACDLIPAKHIYFVMDSCYSGLALTRGSGAYSRDRSYLDEVTRRNARQILTAGGSNQMVADDGPDGHSVFTWALLQGLEGKADLDGNGVITASELGAYVSPIVASFSRQTPAMGNLIGSEGGEFLFELQPEALTTMTHQFGGKELALNRQLADLERKIADKQAELLRLQQSVQAEVEKVAARGAQPGNTTPPVVPVAASTAAPKMRAYDLDRLGRQLYREKKCDEAIRAFEQAVALRPNDPVLLNNLGFLYYETGKYNDAAKWLEKTLAIDPNRKEAQGNIAYTYWKLGRSADAKTHFQRYLELFPASPKAPEVRQILTTL